MLVFEISPYDTGKKVYLGPFPFVECLLAVVGWGRALFGDMVLLCSPRPA